MADAWTVLISNSSLSSGDAWEHLNSQLTGGGGEGGFIYTSEPIKTNQPIQFLINQSQPILNITERITLNIETEQLNINKRDSEQIGVINERAGRNNSL